MKLKIISISFFLLFPVLSVFSQVGIGITTPKAALDVVGGANNYGFLMPRIALTATNVAAPVKDPSTGNFINNSNVGTMIFNTATTAGTYGVLPGLYFWDGVQWVSQFHKYFETKFTQTAGNNVDSNAIYNNITGLSARTFVAPYDGEYHFVFSGYLGAGTVDVNSAKVGFVEGNFKLTINGVDYRKYSHSTSFYNSDTSTDYLELFNESNIIATVILVAGQTCTINASYNGVADDNITEALPHVVGTTAVLGNLCEVNVTYIGR